MTTIDFPSSPQLHDEYDFAGMTWVYDGQGWVIKSMPAPKGDTGDTGAASTVPGPQGPAGPKGDTGDAGSGGGSEYVPPPESELFTAALKYLRNIKDVAIINHKTWVLDQAGALYVAGDNSTNSFGNGTTASSWVFTPGAQTILDDSSNVRTFNTIIANAGNQCLLCTDNLGGLYVNGYNNGAFGVHDDIAVGSLTFKKVLASNARYLPVGSSIFMLDSMGNLKACGNVSSAYGASTTYTDFTQIETGKQYWRMASGDNNLALLKYDNSLWISGDNTFGQLGLGDTTQRSTPYALNAVAVGTVFNAVCVGDGFITALDNNGAIWGAGKNTCGQLGTLGSNVETTFKLLCNSAYFNSIVSTGTSNAPGQTDQPNWAATFAIDQNHNLWASGAGAFGDGRMQTTINSIPDQYTPIFGFFIIATNVSTVACYKNVTVIVKRDGSVWSAGRNSASSMPYANLGNGSLSEASIFTQCIRG